MTQAIADRITKNHVWLMGDKRTMAYSGILMVGDVIIDDTIDTACTNGKDVRYSPDYITTLLDKEVRGLILHEAGHKAFQHLILWQALYEEDPERANKACDYVVNIGIHDLDPYENDIKLPEGALYDVKYKGLDSGQIFDLLKEEGDDGDGSGGKPLDDHDWEGAQEMPDEEAQALSKEIDSALRAGAFIAGKQGGDVSRDFEAMLEPAVDWKEQLREFVSSVCVGKGESTWRKPNRRWLGQDIYMPSQVAESIGNIVVAVDTSGSISGEAVTRALSELVGICDSTTPERVDLLYWDHKIASHEVYFEDGYDKMVASTKPKGGGGTSIESVYNYMDEFNLKPVLLIVITDLCFGFPSARPDCPILWVSVNNNYTTPPYGTTIRIN